MPDAPRTWKPGGLEYDIGTDAQVGRRRFRLLLTLTLLNTLMIGGLIVGPYLMPFAREKWDQWQSERALERERLRIVAFEQKCMTHVWPANQVVYEEDPDAAAKLLAQPNGTYEPAVQDRFSLAGSGFRRVSRRGGGGGSGLFGGGGGYSGGFNNEASVLPPGYQPPVRMAAPDYFQDFLSLADGGSLFGGRGGGGNSGRNEFTEPALLFLHERVTPAGKKFLVQVWLQPGFEIGSNGTQTDGGSFRSYHVTKYRKLIARAWDVPPAPAQPLQVHEWTTLLTLPDMQQLNVAQVPEREQRGASSAPEDVDASAATQPVQINYGNRLRFFAGQVDAADPSHFTIGYELDGTAGSIDGRMRDRGLVLRPSGGAPAGEETMQKMGLSPDPAVEVWDLTAQPAPR